MREVNRLIETHPIKQEAQFKMNRTSKQERIDAVLLLRYHMAKPSPITKVYASYAEIARLCKMPYSTVRNHCLTAIAKHGSADRIGRLSNQRLSNDTTR